MSLRSSLAVLLLPCGQVLGAQPVDLDDVYCALCHFEEGDDFSESVHYQQGLLLCNDCHGGLPFESDESIAKASDTGFIGRPGRRDIAQVCGSCHTASEEFLARGPHHDWQNRDNPTCITCHSNHKVREANLTLMDETCVECHASEAPAVQRGEQIRHDLEANWNRLFGLSGRFDSLAAVDAGVRRASGKLESARASLRRADVATHAWDSTLVAEPIAEFDREIQEVEELIRGHFQHRQRRKYAVGAVWIFIAANLFAISWRRRLSSQQ